jgi:hypothetical protein
MNYSANVIVWALFERAMHCSWHCPFKVVHEQSGKVEYERERLLRIANKLMNFQSGSQQPFALVFEFSTLLVDNFNWNSFIHSSMCIRNLCTHVFNWGYKYHLDLLLCTNDLLIGTLKFSSMYRKLLCWIDLHHEVGKMLRLEFEGSQWKVITFWARDLQETRNFELTFERR